VSKEYTPSFSLVGQHIDSVVEGRVGFHADAVNSTSVLPDSGMIPTISGVRIRYLDARRILDSNSMDP
jgi:hypothetical protein